MKFSKLAPMATLSTFLAIPVTQQTLAYLGQHMGSNHSQIARVLEQSGASQANPFAIPITLPLVEGGYSTPAKRANKRIADAAHKFAASGGGEGLPEETPDDAEADTKAEIDAATNDVNNKCNTPPANNLAAIQEYCRECTTKKIKSADKKLGEHMRSLIGKLRNKFNIIGAAAADRATRAANTGSNRINKAQDMRASYCE